ncbi:MAG: hypothetical protein ACJAZX_001213 [Rickettsiales bacterium]|jgi:hypothetical protein
MKIIKNLLILTLLTATSCSHLKTKKDDTQNSEIGTKEQEKQYVEGTDDIPLFIDLELIEDDSSSFDTMVGNIVISKYFGEYKTKEVKDFYLKSLPQLGWKLTKNQDRQISFNREDDKLKIKFTHSKNNLYVRFFILSAVQ